MDDDADWDMAWDYNKVRTVFEEGFLREWQPAVGSAGCFRYPAAEVESTNGIDFIFYAYHREALEIFHPWILDFDSQCGWTSQLIGNLESAAVYRNHHLTFKSMKIFNGKHREYSRACYGNGEGFQLAIDSHYSALPAALKHCSITSVADLLEKGAFYQGSKGGEPRKKPEGMKYHLMDRVEREYATSSQTSHCNTSTYNPSLVGCCSLDYSYRHH